MNNHFPTLLFGYVLILDIVLYVCIYYYFKFQLLSITSLTVNKPILTSTTTKPMAYKYCFFTDYQNIIIIILFLLKSIRVEIFYYKNFEKYRLKNRSISSFGDTFRYDLNLSIIARRF